MDEQTFNRMLDAARSARLNAHAPYSGFCVGASVLGGSGMVYAGCNVENASYPVTLCAERSALAAAVTGGEKTILAVLILGPGRCPPCGMCRQALAEFGPGMEVIMVGPDGATERRSLSDLLPEAFLPAFLGK